MLRIAAPWATPDTCRYLCEEESGPRAETAHEPRPWARRRGMAEGGHVLLTPQTPHLGWGPSCLQIAVAVFVESLASELGPGLSSGRQWEDWILPRILLCSLSSGPSLFTSVGLLSVSQTGFVSSLRQGTLGSQELLAPRGNRISSVRLGIIWLQTRGQRGNPSFLSL